MTQQYVLCVKASMIRRFGKLDCPGEFSFEIMRGDEDECQEVAACVGGVYSDHHYLGLVGTSVMTAEAWEAIIDKYA